MPPPEFENLVDAHYGALFRFAMSLTRRENEARDLTQQSFLMWARKGHQLKDPSKAKSWLFTTMHRQFLQTRRRDERFPHVELTEVGIDSHVQSPNQARKVDADTLLETMQQMNPTLRAPLALFYLESYTYNEIAECLDIPLGTVKSRISRAVNQLQTLLASGLKPSTSQSSKS